MVAVNEVPLMSKLKDIFDEGYKLYNVLESCNEPMNGHEMQMNVKKCISLMEDSTKLVSLAGVFSRNEHYDEIGTSDMAYFLLPYFLGQLTQKLTGLPANRINLVEVSEVYFKDFLRRCKDYEFFDGSVHLADSISDDSKAVSVAKPSQNELESLMSSARTRNEKMEKYRKKSELNKQIEELKILMAMEHIDDEVKREFFVKLINASILEAEESLDMINEEKKILEYMKNMRPDENSAAGRRAPPKNPSSAKLKPIIITRDVAQKAIYGIGYPSIPTMTVDEFYEQRVREGIFPDPCHAGPSTANQQPQIDEEQEEIKNEQRMEADDEEYIARARNMDEFKDDHRRGEGNRHNRS